MGLGLFLPINIFRNPDSDIHILMVNVGISLKSIGGLMLGAKCDLTEKQCTAPPKFSRPCQHPELDIMPTQQSQSCLRHLERGGWDGEERKKREKGPGRGQLRGHPFHEHSTKTAPCLSPANPGIPESVCEQLHKYGFLDPGTWMHRVKPK